MNPCPCRGRATILKMLNTSCAPINVGYRQTSETSGIIWALYDRAKAEEEVGWIADTGNMEFAERLTGLSSYTGQPGCGCASEPYTVVDARRVLVKQVVGLNV